MSGPSFPTFFKINEESEKAKEYLVNELLFNRRVRPIITFFKLDVPLFTIYFPLVDTIEERLNTLSQASWLNSSLRGDGLLFAADSVVPVTADGETHDQDVFLIFFANKMGAFVEAKAYSHVPGSDSVDWLDIKIEEENIMKSQNYVVTFLASQFFLTEYILPWEEYVEYLKEKGFEFAFHHPFDEKLMHYAQDYLNA